MNKQDIEQKFNSDLISSKLNNNHWPDGILNGKEQKLDLKNNFELFQVIFKDVTVGLVMINKHTQDNIKELQKQVSGIQQYKHPFHDAVRIVKVDNRNGYKLLGESLSNHIGQAAIQVFAYDNPDKSVGMIVAVPKKTIRKGIVNVAVWRSVTESEGIEFGLTNKAIFEAAGYVEMHKV